ncbi:MAG TPA: DUF309 domain-containing protein [Egibacteraceae bacterium]|nr:DUF309 domain-containing protein [Egibacteraceae bacterium]
MDVFPDRDRNADGRPENARPRDRFGAPLPRGAVDELAHRQEPDAVVRSAEEALRIAVTLFDERRFFEAHEFLEYVWKSDEIPEADREFWKGVTQVAVGCCHGQRRNDAGAVALLERAEGYLSSYPSPHEGIDTAALRAVALDVAAQVREHGASPELEFPAFPIAAKE